MLRKSIYALATGLSLFAVMVVSTASFVYIYQGETPEELLK
ncbi:cyclic lactone autoinducer peptide [Paenibacillus sp. BR2-3]